MKKKILSITSLAVSSLLLMTPVLANETSRTNFGTTRGSSYIYYVGGGGYKQLQATTQTGIVVDEISVSSNYYIVNVGSVGSPSDSNRWSNKAYAQLTYDGGKTMGCNTTHRAKNGSTIVTFSTSAML